MRTTVLAALACALTAGCVGVPSVPQAVSPTPSSSPSPAASGAGPSPSASAAPACTNATQSYAPATSSAYAAEIKQRGYLLVGVSADTRQLGAVDPQHPSVFEGFDIDMAYLVAKGIFGDGFEKKTRFKVITTADRISQLQQKVDGRNNAEGGVDLVARAFTMNCARWEEIAFSAEYLLAHQGLLVPASSTIDSVADLSGKAVCAALGSTSLKNITAENPEAEPVGVATHTDCLVLLQQGKVDAITGDNAILAGYAAQDPTTRVTDDSLTDEPYGLGVNLAHKDFAAFVNSVLARAVTDGSWQRSYDRWLAPSLGPATAPTPRYGRT